jgi:carbon storage regulator
MLVLTRKTQESVVVGQAADSRPLLRVTVLEVRGRVVKLGFDANLELGIHRHEVWERLRAESKAPSLEHRPTPGSKVTMTITTPDLPRSEVSLGY